MRELGGRLDQVELEAERAEERRRDSGWMDRGTEVVPESRQRELGGARSATNRLLRFDDADR
jgi:hypothetical protein